MLDCEGGKTDELVIARRGELDVREAWMNLHYCEMQVRPTAEATS